LKPLLCKIGLHKVDKIRFYVVTKKRPGRKAYRRNYFYCLRCGKRVSPFAVRKIKEREENAN
jgi:hypothetical protein